MKRLYSRYDMRSLSEQRHSNRNVVAIFVFCALICAAATFAQQPESKYSYVSSDHALWRLDLASQGYPSNNPDLQRRRNLANFESITFISDTVLAATFVTRQDIPALQQREDPNRLRPYRLHAIFLDATTGQVLRALDWQTDDPNTGIFPRHAVGFLLLTPDRITSYSADWTPIKELLLSKFAPSGSTIGGIAESPSGKSLVIQFLRPRSPLCFNVRTDALDFSEVPCGALEVFTASDSGIAAPEKLPDGSEIRERISLNRDAFVQYDVSPSTLPDKDGRTKNRDGTGAVRTFCTPCAGIPQFVNNEKLAIYSATYVTIVDRKGIISFTKFVNPRAKWIDEFGRPLRSSANGRRFAVASNVTQRPLNSASGFSIHMSVGDIPAELPFDVEIYDLDAAGRIYTIQINTSHLHEIWGLSLSPNGDKLALDSGGTIHVFALPPTTGSARK